MKLYATVNALKLQDGKLIQVNKGQGSNQSLSIEILADNVQGIPTRANVYRISLNVGNNNELQAELLTYSTGEMLQLTTKSEKQIGELKKCKYCGAGSLDYTNPTNPFCHSCKQSQE